MLSGEKGGSGYRKLVTRRFSAIKEAVGEEGGGKKKERNRGKENLRVSRRADGGLRACTSAAETKTPGKLRVQRKRRKGGNSVWLQVTGPGSRMT